MKTKNLIYIAIIALLFTSCATNSFVQVYKVTPNEEIKLKDNLLVYEDDNCKVSYNLWEDGGNIGFAFYNKTDKSIYINMEESFYIMNGIAYNYFQNRIFKNTNRGTSINTVNLTSDFSVSYNEERIICVPSHSTKNITDYLINKSLFRDCDLYKYPSKKEIRNKTFTSTTSPFVFSNRISYWMGDSDIPVNFENDFYVTEISNYPEDEVVEYRNQEYCGQKSSAIIKYFKNSSPDKFYIQYSKGKDFWIH